MTQYNERFTVAIDADGVVVNFEKRVCDHLGCSPAQLKQPEYRRRMWGAIKHINDNVSPYFEHLEKMPDADVLVNFVKANFVNHYILTACGSTPPNAAAQKRVWFKREYGSGLHVKTVQSSEAKAEFAGPTVILIDDRMKSIDPWTRAGGIGILHTSAADTIRQLKALIANPVDA